MPTKNSPASCTIDGETFTAAEAEFVMEAKHSTGGNPAHAVPVMSAHILVDLNDRGNGCKFQTIKKLFELSKLPSAKQIKEIKIEFWLGLEDENALCSYSFKGWISSLRTSYLGRGTPNGGYNHFIAMVLTPDTTQDSFGQIRIGN